MKAISFLLTAIIAVLSLTSTADAGLFRRKAKKESREENKNLPPEKKMPVADARLAKMRSMIAQGSKNGKLTKAETGTLTRELEGIERREEQYRRSMDKVTPGERKKLNLEITDLHQRLSDKTHNAAKTGQKS